MYRDNHALALAKKIVTQMLTCDLFAVAIITFLLTDNAV